MAHLTCVGHTTADLERNPAARDRWEVRNVLAWRGDRDRRSGYHSGAGSRARPTMPPTWLGFIKQGGGSLVSAPLCVPERRSRRTASCDDDVARAQGQARRRGVESAVTEMVLCASDYFGLVELS